MTEPRTESGRALAKVLAEADIRWPDELTRIAPAVIKQFVVRVEEAVLADLRVKVKRAPGYRMNGVDWVDRTAVLALLDTDKP